VQIFLDIRAYRCFGDECTCSKTSSSSCASELVMMSYLSSMSLSSAIQHIIRFLGRGTFVGYLPCLVSNFNSIRRITYIYMNIHLEFSSKALLLYTNLTRSSQGLLS
jgi:hypothetical protein